MASLGVRSLNNLIGRTDLLGRLPGETEKQRQLDLSQILSDAGVSDDKPGFCKTSRNAPFDRGELAEKMVVNMLPSIETGSGGEFLYPIKNSDRSIGARLSGKIARRYGNDGMTDRPVTVRLKGTAGQSFGDWGSQSQDHCCPSGWHSYCTVA